MALFKQMGLICEDSIVHPDMNDVLNQKLGTSQVDYPSSKWADKVAVLGDPLPSKTASGSIAHFTDGADNVPLDTGIFYFNPVQASGTPTPSTPLPISGHTGLTATRTGANIWGGLLMAQSFEGATGYSIDTENKTFTFQRSSPARVLFSPTFNSVQYSILITYTSTGNNTSLRFRYKDGTTSDISLPEASTKTTVIVSSSANKELQDVALGYKTANSVTVYYDESGLFEGIITAQDFEAYEGTIYPVSWTEEGTIYGGYYNSVTGELWKTYESEVFNGAESETWAAYASTTYYGFSKQLPNMKSGNNQVGYSNFLKVQANYSETGIRLGANNTTMYLLHITDTISGVTDVASWKTYLQTHNLQVVYPLATPVLVGIIDPTKIKTFEGVNNIWNDGGGISEVGYRSKASGGVTPQFTDTVICDNSALSTGTLTFTNDIEDYDILDFECYNADTQKITHYLTIPEVIMAIKNASSDYVNFNEIGTNQYVCYGVSSDNLTWTVRSRRNMLIKSVTGYVCSNMTVTKTEFYKRNSISPVVAVVEPVEDVLSYHYIFTASGDGANDQTQPCGMAMQIDSLFNDNSIGFFNRYNSLTAPIIAKSHSISCADAYGDNYWILCYYGLKFT